jgi:hypothetical protein
MMILQGANPGKSDGALATRLVSRTPNRTPALFGQETTKAATRYEQRLSAQSGRQDLNLRPLAPHCPPQSKNLPNCGK